MESIQSPRPIFFVDIKQIKAKVRRKMEKERGREGPKKFGELPFLIACFLEPFLHTKIFSQ